MWPRLSINPKIRERVTTRKLSHPHHENQSANYYLILHNLLAIDGYDIQPQASFTRSSHITYQSTLISTYILKTHHKIKSSQSSINLPSSKSLIIIFCRPCSLNNLKFIIRNHHKQISSQNLSHHYHKITTPNSK